MGEGMTYTSPYVQRAAESDRTEAEARRDVARKRTEVWLNVFTDTDTAVHHETKDEAMAELLDRAHRRGEDRITDYWTTVCVYDLRGGRTETYSYDLKYDADDLIQGESAAAAKDCTRGVPWQQRESRRFG